MTFKKKIIIGVGIVILVCLTLGALKFSNQLKANEVTAQRIKIARQAAKTIADGVVETSMNELESSVVASSPTYRSVVDICYVDHQDMGWFTRNWYESCYLRYVSGFNTTLNPSEVKQNISEKPSFSLYFGDMLSLNNSDNTRGRDCALFSSKNSPELVYIPANYQPGRRDYKCIVDPTKGTDTGALSTEPSVKTYATFDLKNVNKTNNQVWLIYEKHYYNQDLGCSIKPLCLQPRAKFVHPGI